LHIGVWLQYYYNSQTQQFLYWDSEKSTYLPAPTTQDNQTTAVTTMTTTTAEATVEEQKKEDEQKKRSLTPEKKVKVAKKIVKASLCSSQVLCLVLLVFQCIKS